MPLAPATLTVTGIPVPFASTTEFLPSAAVAAISTVVIDVEAAAALYSSTSRATVVPAAFV